MFTFVPDYLTLKNHGKEDHHKISIQVKDSAQDVKSHKTHLDDRKRVADET